MINAPVARQVLRPHPGPHPFFELMNKIKAHLRDLANCPEREEDAIIDKIIMLVNEHDLKIAPGVVNFEGINHPVNIKRILARETLVRNAVLTEIQSYCLVFFQNNAMLINHFDINSLIFQKLFNKVARLQIGYFNTNTAMEIPNDLAFKSLMAKFLADVIAKCDLTHIKISNGLFTGAIRDEFINLVSQKERKGPFIITYRDYNKKDDVIKRFASNVKPVVPIVTKFEKEKVAMPSLERVSQATAATTEPAKEPSPAAAPVLDKEPIKIKSEPQEAKPASILSMAIQKTKSLFLPR